MRRPDPGRPIDLTAYASVEVTGGLVDWVAGVFQTLGHYRTLDIEDVIMTFSYPDCLSSSALAGPLREGAGYSCDGQAVMPVFGPCIPRPIRFRFRALREPCPNATPFFVTYWPKPKGNRMPTNELITALGQAVAAVWGKLPAEVQQALFEAAIGSAGEGSREKLAIYLHDRHPRTSPSDKPGREVPEPDSLGG